MTGPVHPRPAPTRPVSVAGIPLPDSAAAVTAERLCRSVSTDVLYAHAARSFVFAALLAQREGVKLDEEALYVGSILHDLGLTDTYRHPTTPFEHISADIARQLTAERGWPTDRTDTVHRAVVLHMASEVSASESAEARMLEAGVALDVTGHRLGELDLDNVRDALLAYPRGPFVLEFSALMSEEARQKPDSAAAALVGRGLLTRIAQAPFARGWRT